MFRSDRKFSFKVCLLLLIVSAVGVESNGNGEIIGFPQIKETSPSYVPQGCLLNPEPGRCRAWLPRYYFNTSTGFCKEFIYGGCEGNWNRFQTVEDCQMSCSCKTAPETGPCRGHIRRWFYSPKHGVCRPFIFGGCGGNANNYNSWYECSSACGYPDQKHGWWEWWNNSQGQRGETGAVAKGSRGYTQADFMKDYMMLGMIGEIELEGIQDIMNLYVKLQKMGGLTTMQGASGSNSGTLGPADMGLFGQGQSEMGEHGEGHYIWGEDFGNLGSNTGLFGQTTDSWGQGTGGQAGSFDNGRWETSGTALNGLSADSGNSFTPLGYRGSVADTFTPVGNLGSLSNVIGTGSSNMAKEIEVLKSVLGSGGYQKALLHLARGGTGSTDLNSWVPNEGISIIEFIKNIAAGRLTPNSMMFLARMLGAMDRTGKIDMNIILSQLAKTMANLGLSSNTQLKGVAQRYGALDINGNINMNRFLHGIAGSIGGLVAQISRIFGPQKAWPMDTSALGTNFVRFIKQLGSGRLSPMDMSNMAKMLGVVDTTGKININALVQRLMDALSNPGIAADLKGTAERLGAVDNNGNIIIQVFLRRIASSMGKPWTGFGTSGAEILKFISQLAMKQTSPQGLKNMALKVGAIDKLGNVNFGLLAKGIVSALSSPSTTADLKGVASRMGALDSRGNIKLNQLLRAVSDALKRGLDGFGGPFGRGSGFIWSPGSPERTSETLVVPADRFVAGGSGGKAFGRRSGFIWSPGNPERKSETLVVPAGRFVAGGSGGKAFGRRSGRRWSSGSPERTGEAIVVPGRQFVKRSLNKSG